MKRLMYPLLCGTTMMAMPAVAQAQQAAPPSQAATPDQSAPTAQSTTSVQEAPNASQGDGTQADTTGVTDGSVGDIVVTARRQSESLQNVPATVQAVSGESIQKLNLTQFQDVASVVPGLSLTTGNNSSGNAPAPSIRGVSYDAGSSPSPTVDIYVNEVPINSSVAFQTIYDLGGVEVLRGPQGTARGRTAPSGAILLSTRKPDLNEAGGYVSMLGTEKGSINGQAAVNVPLVSDKVALRLAGAVDQGPGNFVKSVNSGVNPFRNTESGRASLAVKPFDAFDASVVYQYTHADSRQYLQLEGAGAVGGVVPTAPAGYNGPVLRAGDRLSASEFPRFSDQSIHQITGTANLSVLGHVLSYVGGYVESNMTTRTTLDSANLTRGDAFQNLRSKSQAQSHEVRLASDNWDGFLSYAVGYFHSFSKGGTNGTTLGAFLPGAFGSPAGVPDPRLFDPTYSLGIAINNFSRNTEDSFFGTATLKLGSKTELTGGARYIISKQQALTGVLLTTGKLAAPVPAPCALAGLVASPYPGYCDIALNLNSPAGGGSSNDRNTPVVYSASLSHRFTDGLLAYATVGSSWRRGGSNLFTSNAESNPALTALNFLPNETSTSYEVGLKTNFLDRRLRINVAGFYQKFKNLNFQLQAIPYLVSNGAQVAVETATFNTAADAVVKGFDADASFAITPFWSIGVTGSYADGKVDNDLVPCRDSNFDGVPDGGQPTAPQFRAANVFIAQCTTNQSVSRDPIWSGTAQSELRQPIGSSEAYLRGLASFYPGNSRRNVGNRVPAYTLLNVYAGVRGADGAWDVGLFARNALNSGVRLSREPNDLLPNGNTTATFGSSGYREVTYTPPFEAGLTVRFAFGSR